MKPDVNFWENEWIPETESQGGKIHDGGSFHTAIPLEFRWVFV